MPKKRWMFSLVLAISGFLIGRFWPEFQALVSPTMAQLHTSWRSADTYFLQNPLESGMLFSVIGAVMLPGSMAIWKKAKAASLRPSIFSDVFENEERVNVVVSHMRQSSFTRLGREQTITLPSNAPFIPYGLAQCMASLTHFVGERYDFHKQLAYIYDNERWEMGGHTFLSIGGSFTNEVTRSIIEGGIIPDFQIDDIPTVTDEQDRYISQRAGDPESLDAPLSADYGFLIFLSNPWNRNYHVCLAFGIWPQGTFAAVRALTELSPSSEHAKRFRSAVKEKKNVIGVLRVNVIGLTDGQPEWIKTRLFN